MRIATVLALLAFAQQPTGWKDPSPHVARFITVGKDLPLEVLDWGGSGRAVVLLAGGGDTAHVFDDFAPKLARDFHVYGITRRGFGQSGFVPASGADTYGDDVLAVMSALALNRPVLVGHSVGGQELSSVATRYPSRVAGLVYLEAAYPYAVDNGTGPTLDDMQKLRPPQPPPPSESEAASFPALQQYFSRVLGFTYPEAELRQQRPVSPDGHVGTPRNFPGYATLIAGVKKFGDIRVPALVFFASPHGFGTWVDNNADPVIRRQAAAQSAASEPLVERQIKVVEAGIPRARIVRLPGANHYVYLSNEADVIREMRVFVRGLP
jgi:pimeloyl-ACP methyl ester carboxylesterase